MDYKKIFGWLFILMGFLFLVSILAWTLNTLHQYTIISHEMEMEELELEKEIALINNVNNTIIKKDYECEYRLANQTIQHLIDIRGIEKYYEETSR